MGPQGLEQAVVLEVAGPELEDQRPHLGERLALEVAQRAELLLRRRRVAVDEQLRAPRDRVMLNSAWVTESWSSRARWARSWLDASSPAWRRRSRSSRSRSVMSRVAPWMPVKTPSTVVPIELTSTGTVPPFFRTRSSFTTWRTDRLGGQLGPALEGGGDRGRVDDPARSARRPARPGEAGHRLDRLGQEREDALVVGREDHVRARSRRGSGSAPRTPRSSRSRRSRSVMSRAAPWIPVNTPSRRTPTRADLEREDPAVGVPERRSGSSARGPGSAASSRNRSPGTSSSSYSIRSRRALPTSSSGSKPSDRRTVSET